jgi:hypothetical protein
MRQTSARLSCSALALGVLALAAVPAPAQDKPAAYQATASLKTVAGAAMTFPVTVSVNRWTSDADREKALGALRSGGTGAFHKLVSGWPEVGQIQIGQVTAPLRYARTLPVAGGTLITVATAQPIYHIGGGATDAKPKAGYDVAVATFQVDAAGKGSFGDLAPAAKVKVDDKGAIVIEDYAAEVVTLKDISRK